MENNANTPFIFYLCLENDLPKHFYLFDRLLKEHGYILVPVKIDQLQSLASSAEQDQLIVLTTTTQAREYRIYNQRIRKLLKFVLKSKRITFLHLSSFSKLSDYKAFNLMKNYYFMKFPLDARVLASRIVNFHVEKQEQRTLWPGGKRSNATATV